MDSNFLDSALAYLLGDEGNKFTNDPDDSGGPTKYGITLAMWEKFTGLPAKVSDIESLSIIQVKPFYELEFWQPLKCDQIMDAGIAIAIFDTSVLFGTGAIALEMQNAVNLFGGAVRVDGIIGNETLKALNLIPRFQFLAGFHESLLQRIKRIIEKRPVDAKYQIGWEARIDRLLTLDTNTEFNISFT